MNRTDRRSVSAALLFVVCASALAVAQAPAPGPQVVSPEVTADRQIVFRILAPQAQAVRPLDIPAGFILDNLVAAKSAKPMIVVMPAGHTRAPGNPIASAPGDPFVNDFVTDVMPYVQKTYRVLTDRANTAIAGLSMGGGQMLNIAMAHPDRFAYIGVYSSGLLGVFPVSGRGGAAAPSASSAADWEQRNAAALSSTSMKKGLKLFWFSTGKDDFLIKNTVATVELFKKHGFTPVYEESAGGHTWLNWRDYLSEFAPQLFQ